MSIFLKKCQVFGDFLTFKWQFSGGSDRRMSIWCGGDTPGFADCVSQFLDCSWFSDLVLPPGSTSIVSQSCSIVFISTDKAGQGTVFILFYGQKTTCRFFLKLLKQTNIHITICIEVSM